MKLNDDTKIEEAIRELEQHKFGKYLALIEANNATEMFGRKKIAHLEHKTHEIE